MWFLVHTLPCHWAHKHTATQHGRRSSKQLLSPFLACLSPHSLSLASHFFTHLTLLITLSLHSHLLCLQVLLPHDDAVKIEGASVGEKWLVLSTRSRAQQTLVTYALPPGGGMPTALGEGQKVVFDEPAYTLSGGEFLRSGVCFVVCGWSG